ncbi:hypothetical protein GTY75_05275 [Streptomyces sp. SID8381]|uniref:hypothetical protein n=1 Tax=unclassified Streptomyces TaxID=2593676 RepID=UPI00037565CD|nr:MULTISPECIES: hypothetical protein [unclassified Streptomyces]MYX26085.1 hypothetical protein [Streptomyces sp. SID8381]
MINAKAFKMIEGRFSDHVKLFNHYDVNEADSDTHYWLVKGRVELARVALERAPELKVTTLARSLGDVYRAVRTNLTPAELKRWDASAEAIADLNDKYGI